MPKNLVISVIDVFYPPFRKFIPLQTFRYLACGGGNTLLDILLYFISYHYILHKQMLDLGFVVISPYIAAFFMAFCISFPLGFWLMSSIVFTGSTLRGRVQLFRYFLLVGVCILLNYVFLKLFVEQWGIYPTPSKMLTTVIVVLFSYVTQKHFTFKVQKQN
ncbi:MAG TPA: GtrA family protein [Chitinophagaceae bacterium]|nr:GtrA family protein [Chitinophagaceae bacterium]